jgi:DNA-binding NarL/FixJ family response regulator
MRVVLVGTPAQRARLRAALAGEAIEVVGEVLTTAAATALAADALCVAAETAERPAADADSFRESLTPREIEVLELLAEGFPNRAIAARLGISDQTVKSHVASVCGKLGAANRTEAVRRAVRRGLIPL